jgi:hypothetical protein
MPIHRREPPEEPKRVFGKPCCKSKMSPKSNNCRLRIQKFSSKEEQTKSKAIDNQKLKVQKVKVVWCFGREGRSREDILILAVSSSSPRTFRICICSNFNMEAADGTIPARIPGSTNRCTDPSTNSQTSILKGELIPLRSLFW